MLRLRSLLNVSTLVHQRDRIILAQLQDQKQLVLQSSAQARSRPRLNNISIALPSLNQLMVTDQTFADPQHRTTFLDTPRLSRLRLTIVRGRSNAANFGVGTQPLPCCKHCRVVEP